MSRLCDELRIAPARGKGASHLPRGGGRVRSGPAALVGHHFTGTIHSRQEAWL